MCWAAALPFLPFLSHPSLAVVWLPPWRQGKGQSLVDSHQYAECLHWTTTHNLRKWFLNQGLFLPQFVSFLIKRVKSCNISGGKWRFQACSKLIGNTLRGNFQFYLRNSPNVVWISKFLSIRMKIYLYILNFLSNCTCFCLKNKNVGSTDLFRSKKKVFCNFLTQLLSICSRCLLLNTIPNNKKPYQKVWTPGISCQISAVFGGVFLPPGSWGTVMQ